MGYSTRSGEYTRSTYFDTFAHKNPRVTGCSGSPWIFVARPSCTVIKTPQASGQSCGQAAFTTSFIPVDYMGGKDTHVETAASAVPRSKASGGSTTPAPKLLSKTLTSTSIPELPSPSLCSCLPSS